MICEEAKFVVSEDMMRIEKCLVILAWWNVEWFRQGPSVPERYGPENRLQSK